MWPACGWLSCTPVLSLNRCCPYGGSHRGVDMASPAQVKPTTKVPRCSPLAPNGAPQQATLTPSGLAITVNSPAPIYIRQQPSVSDAPAPADDDDSSSSENGVAPGPAVAARPNGKVRATGDAIIASDRMAKAARRKEREQRERAKQDELDKVKAMTMHDMIETIYVGGTSRQKKLLFLTGEQADQIQQRPASLEAMLKAFDVGSPQLVINLLESGGFGDWTQMRTAEGWAGLNARWAPGVSVDAPFVDAEDERAAEMRLDLFMSDVLIPLAAQTKAVVICCAIPNLCILSASFTRMFNAVKAKCERLAADTIDGASA